MHRGDLINSLSNTAQYRLGTAIAWILPFHRQIKKQNEIITNKLVITIVVIAIVKIAILITLF